jgi:hypothetical protein
MYLASGLKSFQSTLEDALARLTEHAVAGSLLPAGRHLTLEDVRVFSWPQFWSDYTCGFGSLAGQAITIAQTVVVLCGLSGALAVYHNEQFAYLVRRQSDAFRQAFTRQRLPGQVEFLRNRSKWDVAEA